MLLHYLEIESQVVIYVQVLLDLESVKNEDKISKVHLIEVFLIDKDNYIQNISNRLVLDVV